MFKIKFLFFFLIAFSAVAISGQTARKPLPKTISGGVVNSKAINLPKPEYPPAALSVRAAGAVNVQVTIDENGDVISAEVASGHPLLREAAVQAARQAKFSPTKLSGQPVKVTGVIVYNFNLAENYEDKVEALTASMMLSLLRLSASHADFEHMDKHFQLQEMLNDAPADFPGYAKELDSLKSFKQMTPAKRIEIVNSLASSVKSKLNAAEAWQFELGEHFGEFVARFMLSIRGEEFLPEKFDQAAVKLNLAKIKDLTYSAPPEFPVAVLEKFKEFAVFADKEQTLTPENLEPMMMKFMAIVETISPDSGK
jgi:TonB family protein